MFLQQKVSLERRHFGKAMNVEQITFRPNRQWEYFGDQSPAYRTNSVRKVGDICKKSALLNTIETVCT